MRVVTSFSRDGRHGPDIMSVSGMSPSRDMLSQWVSRRFIPWYHRKLGYHINVRHFLTRVIWLWESIESSVLTIHRSLTGTQKTIVFGFITTRTHCAYSQYNKQYPRSTLTRHFDICPLCHSKSYGKTLCDYGFYKHFLDCINSHYKIEQDGELCGHSSVSTLSPPVFFLLWKAMGPMALAYAVPSNVHCW